MALAYRAEKSTQALLTYRVPSIDPSCLNMIAFVALRQAEVRSGIPRRSISVTWVSTARRSSLAPFEGLKPVNRRLTCSSPSSPITHRSLKLRVGQRPESSQTQVNGLEHFNNGEAGAPSHVTWSSFGDWIQLGAAIATMLAVPWVVDALKYVFRERLIVHFQPLQWIGRTTSWRMRATNKTRNVDSQRLLIYPADSRARIKAAKLIDGYAGLVAQLDLKGQHLVVTSSFWPAGRDLRLSVQFDRATYPMFESSTYPVRPVMVSPGGGARLSPGVQVRIGQLRVGLLGMQFMLVAAVAVIRIIYLGLVR